MKNLQAIFQIKTPTGWLDYCRETVRSYEHAETEAQALGHRCDTRTRVRVEDWSDTGPRAPNAFIGPWDPAELSPADQSNGIFRAFPWEDIPATHEIHLDDVSSRYGAPGLIRLDDASSRYGAPMGRSEYLAYDFAGPVRIAHMPLYDGGYDAGGAYWGTPSNLYICESECGELRMFCRARNVTEAKSIFEQRPQLFKAEFEWIDCGETVAPDFLTDADRDN